MVKDANGATSSLESNIVTTDNDDVNWYSCDFLDNGKSGIMCLYPTGEKKETTQGDTYRRWSSATYEIYKLSFLEYDVSNKYLKNNNS